MYYVPRHRIGFFHIPKTGGSAFGRFLVDALGKRGDVAREVSRVRWHEPIADKRAALGAAEFDRAVILANVRDPYAVVVSMYFWCRKKVAENHVDLDQYPDTRLVAAMDFAQYLDWYVRNEPPFEHFLADGGDVPANVRLLRLEHLHADADAVLNGELGLGIDIDVPVWNASSHGPPMSYLDDAAIARINEHYAWAFARLYADRRVPAGAAATGVR